MHGRAPHVAVVGGGISGLAAAHRLRMLLGPQARITVIEQSDRLGGKLRTTELAGVRFDVGAEAFLHRKPEAQELINEVGLADHVVHPTAAKASVHAAGRTHQLPHGTRSWASRPASRQCGTCCRPRARCASRWNRRCRRSSSGAATSPSAR